MADDHVLDRSITVGRDAINSVITSGDGNSVIVYQTIMGAVTPLAGGRNPYLGLLAFTEADADRFFGREKLVSDLWIRFSELMTAPPEKATERFLAILGPSGSGKSSLARAGLLAELARRPVGGKRQRVAVLTPGDQPLQALAAVLARVATQDPAPVAKTQELLGVLQATTEGVHDGLRRIAASLGAPGEPLVILVDQFEEIYSLCRDEPQRKGFIETLLNAAANPAGDVGVIVTLRTDFLGATQADNALNQTIAKQSVLVPTMSADELRRAIAEPAARAGHPLDEDTIRRLVAETEGREGALPLLQFVLVRAWEGMEKGVTAATTVNELGGVGGALGAEAERIFTGLSPNEQVIAQRAFLAMVRFNDALRPTRHRALLSQLVADDEAVADDIELAQTRAVIDRFAQPGARLVTLSATADGDQTVEVSHEALFQHWERLKAWLADGMDDIRLHMRVAEAATLWDGAQRPDGSLWRPPDLDLLRGLAAKPTAGLTSVERAFCQASDTAHAQEVKDRRRREWLVRVVALILLVLTVAAAGTGWLALQQSAKAEIQRSNAFAATAEQAIDGGNAGLGLLLALAALPEGKVDTPDYLQASAALRSALLNLTELHTLPHPREVTAAQFVANDRRVVTSSADNKVRLWDIAAGRLLKTVAGRAVYASPDGARFATFGGDHFVRIWDAATGALSATIPGASEAKAVHFARDAGRVAIAWEFQAAGVWDAATGRQVAAFGGWKDPPALDLDFAPSGAEVVTVQPHGPVQIWDAATGGRRGGPLFRLTSDDGKPQYSPDGRYLAVSDYLGSDQNLQIWNFRTRRLVGGVEGGVDGAFSPDSRYLARPFDGRVEIIETASARTLDGSLGVDGGTIYTAQFMPDGHQVLTASLDRTAQLWSAETGTRTGKPFAGHFGAVNLALGSQDGRLVLTASADGTVRIWRTTAGLAWDEAPPAPPTAKGKPFLFIGAEAAEVRNSADGSLIATLSTDLVSSRRGDISPDGRVIATSLGNDIKLWDARTGQPLRRIKTGHTDLVRFVAFSPDGRNLLTASADVTARVRDVASGAPVGPPLIGHSAELNTAAFSPDGKRVVTGSDDFTARIWSVESGKTLATLRGHAGGIVGVSFSHDGRRVVTSGYDQTMRVWDAASGRPLATMSGSAPYAVLSPDDRLIATSDGTKAVRLWDTATGQPLARSELPSLVSALSWSADGRRLIALTEDGPMTTGPGVLYGADLRKEACRRRPRDFTEEERRTYGLGKSADVCAAKAGSLRRAGLRPR